MIKTIEMENWVTTKDFLSNCPLAFCKIQDDSSKFNGRINNADADLNILSPANFSRYSITYTMFLSELKVQLESRGGTSSLD